MPSLGTKFTEQELALIRKHAELVGRAFDDHVRKLLVGSARAFVEADGVGALEMWTGRKTQHVRCPDGAEDTGATK